MINLDLQPEFGEKEVYFPPVRSHPTTVRSQEYDMLTIFGKPHARGGFCDGVSRRDFLTIGGTLLGGCLALPNLLAAEARSGIEVVAQGHHQHLPARRPAAPSTCGT